MTQTKKWSGRTLALLVTAALTASPAFADKPEGKGKNKNNEHSEKSQHRQDKGRDDNRGNHAKGGSTSRQEVRFVDQHKGSVREYYAQEFSRGFCPPGLAKKNNGCMPPGQAKKWHVGKPIPRDVVYYDLPPKLVVQIGTPPTGHRYVRIASDILLIAVGTGMVIDAIQDLGRM